MEIDRLPIQDSSVELYGLKFYGSPWTPSCGSGWAYNVPREELSAKWDMIPADTDILLTHGPPLGIMDTTFTKEKAGSESLLHTVVERVRPRFHIFGHIHEGEEVERRESR